jgi:hypothetical protein
MKFNKLANLYLEAVAGSFKSSHNDDMKNKKSKYSNKELINAATIMKDWYMEMAVTIEARNPEMAEHYKNMSLQLKEMLGHFKLVDIL